jgi:hypothetical protein
LAQFAQNDDPFGWSWYCTADLATVPVASAASGGGDAAQPSKGKLAAAPAAPGKMRSAARRDIDGT